MSIFKENIAYRPFRYPWAVSAEKQHRVDMVWHEGQVELQDDLRQYNSSYGLATATVSHESNKIILDRNLMIFTEMDKAVGTGYCKLLPYVCNNEIRTMMMTFAAREVTHQRAYALAAETFGFTDSEWAGFHDYKAMQDKIDLISGGEDDLSIPLNFAKFLSVLLLGEGISLFGAFACLLNLKRHGKLVNFNSVNEWSLKDETEHVKYNIRVLDEIRKDDLSEAESIDLDRFIVDMVEKYVDAEYRYIDLMLEYGDQENLSKEDMRGYIEYLGKLRLFQLKIIPLSEVPDNPLDWLDYIISGKTHTNFFEARVVDYSHAGLPGDIDYSKYLTLIN